MPALGIGIAFFGYWVMYYGLTQVQSGNWGFLDLGIPGRWTPEVAGTPKDSGATGNISESQYQSIEASVSTSTDPSTQTPSGAPNSQTIGTLGTNPSGAAIGGFDPAGFAIGSAQDKAAYPPNGYAG